MFFMQDDLIVWIVRKDGRDAICRLVPHVLGNELRVEIAGTLLLSAVCQTDDDVLDYHPTWRSALEEAGWARLILLRCRDCVNSVTMRRHLDAALNGLDRPLPYEVIDIDMLSDHDPRAGYPGPTLLWDGVDLFGLPQATLPYGGPI